MDRKSEKLQRDVEGLLMEEEETLTETEKEKKKKKVSNKGKEKVSAENAEADADGLMEGHEYGGLGGLLRPSLPYNFIAISIYKNQNCLVF